MQVNKSYIFTSERLGFRNWIPSDIESMVAISSDPEVMRFFPYVARPDQTIDFITRMQDLFHEKGYCYFAVDLLETDTFIGFIGLNDISYDASFSPAVDIGWRLAKSHWGLGYATEGAKRCLKYAFEDLDLDAIVSTTAEINTPSISVMKKIGMTKKMDFKHPRLEGHPTLEDCVCYDIKNIK